MRVLYLLFLFLLLISSAKYTSGYRILGLIPFSGRSHYICQQPIMEELARRGHEVVVVTSYEEENPLPNYKQIVVNRKMLLGPDTIKMEKIAFESFMQFIWDGIFETTEHVFNSSSFQEFIKNDKSHFDLIFVEYLYSPVYYMFAHKYKAPMVAMGTMGFLHTMGTLMGSPLVYPYMSHEFLNYNPPMSLWQKVRNIYSSLYEKIWSKYYLFPMHQAFADKHFSSLQQPLPLLEDLEKNISVMFLNSHYTFDIVRPYVPGIVEVGGLFIKEPKLLPQKLKKFLDEAVEGVIYFSFGSNVKSKDMSPEKLKIILNVFRSLKQKVLWKWEDENLIGKPDNVMLGKWLPQNDILAHKNVKLFITHGGLLSTQEAIYHGVPVIGIPFIADQHLNTEKMAAAEIGIKLAYSELTETILAEAIRKIINDKKYSEKVRILSSRFKDRPMSAMNTTIYWIEYVIRHKGAPFMRSPIADMSTFEYGMLDVLFYLMLIIATLIVLTWKIVQVIYNKCIKNCRSKKKIL